MQQPFIVPCGSDGRPLPKHRWAATQLRSHLSNLEQIHELLVSSEAQHLDELSALNRMATALSERRCYDEVVNDTLQEVTALSECERAWMVDFNDQQAVAHVHVLGDPVIGPSSLPKPVQMLCERVHRRADRSIHHATVKRPGGDVVFVALPVMTAQHLIGCLVIRTGRIDLREAEHTRRLIMSMLRQAAVACENDRLMEAVGEMMVEVVYAFAGAVESRDPYTGGHVQRVTAYAMALGRMAGVNRGELALLQMGGLLHDIGKIAIPDDVLRKPGKLTDDEFAIIRAHPVCGHQLLSNIPHLTDTLDIVRHHHERWDGLGYPDRIAGEEIGLLSRIMAIADSYDAMTSDRPYRDGMPHDVAMAEILKNAGSQFDPALVKVFGKLSAGQLDAAARNMKVACDSNEHPNTMNVSGLLELNMRKATRGRELTDPGWEVSSLPAADESAKDQRPTATAPEAEEKAVAATHNEMTLCGTTADPRHARAA